MHCLMISATAIAVLLGTIAYAVAFVLPGLRPEYEDDMDNEAEEYHEEHVPNEDGNPSNAFDWEAQADLDRHAAEFPDGYR